MSHRLKPKGLKEIGREQTNTRTLQHQAETSETSEKGHGRTSHSSNRSYWPKRMNLVLPYGNLSILDPGIRIHGSASLSCETSTVLNMNERKLSWGRNRRFWFYAGNVETISNSSNEITLQRVLQVMYGHVVNQPTLTTCFSSHEH